MMMTSILLPVARLFCAVSLCGGLLANGAGAQQDGESPATSAAREAYRLASEELTAARNELEGLVLDLEDDFVNLTRGAKAATLKNALVVAMHDSVPAVQARLVAR